MYLTHTRRLFGKERCHCSQFIMLGGGFKDKYLVRFSMAEGGSEPSAKQRYECSVFGLKFQKSVKNQNILANINNCY